MIKETSVYAGIVKMDDNPDGTLTVYGKATDDSLDIDQQICDAVWLDKAMPEWFTTGGNIREQHSNIAAGVAEEYERKQDGHYISALIVDPVSVKKVKSRVLKGFSIGIKSPRVVRDEKAANGRIIDGQIVEVSLVDRPANPNARLVLAKSASGTMVKTEEYVEKHGDHDQSEHGNWATGGGGKDKPSKDKPSKDKPSGGSRSKIGENAKEISDYVRDAVGIRADMMNWGFDQKDINQAKKGETRLGRAFSKLEDARDADNDADHQKFIEQAMSQIDAAATIYSAIETEDANDLSDYLGQAWFELDEYLADFNPDYEPYLGRSATLKTGLSKHGDHDQSEHGNWASGGGGGKDKPSKDKPSGGSDKPSGRSYEEMLSDPIEGERYRGDASIYDSREEEEEDREVQSIRGRNDKEVDGFFDSVVDSHDEFDEYLDNLDEGRQNNDNDDEKQGRITERAQSALHDAQSDFDDATRPGLTLEEHHDLVESAASKLEEAINTLSTGNSNTQSLQGGIRITLRDVNNYLSGIDKTTKGEEPLMRERKKRIKKSTLRKETNGMPMGGQSNVMPSREEMTKRYADARKSLDEITRMCKECGYDDIIEKQYGETAEQETAEGSSVAPETAQEEAQEARGDKPLDKELVAENGEEELKSATRKCLECGCNMPADSHGNPNVSTAVMSSPDQMPVGGPVIQPPTPKSVETILPTPATEEVGTIIEDENSDEEDSADKSLLADVSITNIVEKAVKSAMDSIQKELAELKSAKEAVENKAITLEKELATAKSLAIGGGPKRTTMATGAKTSNEWKAKADLYFRKASETTDKDLAKGYREMARDFQAKATIPSEVK